MPLQLLSDVDSTHVDVALVGPLRPPLVVQAVLERRLPLGPSQEEQACPYSYHALLAPLDPPATRGAAQLVVVFEVVHEDSTPSVADLIHL